LYRELTSSAPDELIAHAVLATVPEFGPALVVQACYSGPDLAAGERVLAPLRQFGPPAVDLIAPRSYAELYMMLTPPLLPGLAYIDSAYSLRQPADCALDEIVALAAEQPSPLCMINLHQIHGAATRVPADATAFALREAHYAVVNAGAWMAGQGEAETAWVQRAHERMQPYAGRGLYVNFLGDDGDEAIRAAYRGNYARLVAVKHAYDPRNLFRLNQNIRPQLQYADA
jgi:hypothetical protein